MNRFYIIIIIILSLCSQKAMTQGLLQGTIIDKKTKESLIGVNIILSDPTDDSKLMTHGTTTDLDGHYKIRLASGAYRLVFSYVSYKTVEMMIEIKEGEVLQHNIMLEENAISLDAVEVVAIVRRESENILLMDQKRASVIAEKMGSQELSRKGASNVAAGVKKVAGISVVGSKQLFVRGLGDRYNSAELNGLPIASPDPNKKVIKLDVFPSGLVQYLGVHKAYSAMHYADYTGALINIVTKEYPEYGFLECHVGTGYNTQSTGRDFYQIQANGLRYLGLDVAARKALTPSKYLVSDQGSMPIGQDFEPSAFGTLKQKALPSASFALAGGKLFNLNEKRKLGTLFNIAFNNGYKTTTNVVQRQINKQNIVDGDFISDAYSYNTYLSAFAGLTYIPNSQHSFTYNLLWVNNGIDEYKSKTGSKPDWSNGERRALVRNAQYINYRLMSHQLIGKHSLSDKSKLQWAANMMQVAYQMPDRRELVFWTQDDGQGNAHGTWGFMTYDPNLASKRIVADQQKYDFNGRADITYQWKEHIQLQGGMAARHQSLAYHSYFFGYSFWGALAGNLSLPVDITQAQNYFGSSYLKNIRNNSSDIMGYQGNSQVYAAFAQSDITLSTRLQMQAGLRVEASQMAITPNTNTVDGYEEAITFGNIDLFPALSIKYQLAKDMNLRLAASRSLTRPSFFEKSPALILPEQGNNRFVGNIGTKAQPNNFGYYLENAYSHNIDLKWEWFPRADELVALSAYGKIIHDPIENISYIQGGTDKTYSVRNFPSNAQVAGLEFEIKKKIKQWHIGCNAALIHTHLSIPADANELQSHRRLQGAAPYLLNADIGYQLKYGAQHDKSSYIALIYNMYGKRLHTVGINQGNQYQLPYQQLNLLINNKITDRISLKLSFTNLLNARYTIEQDIYTDKDQANTKTGSTITQTYTQGIGASISFKYKINQQ